MAESGSREPSRIDRAPSGIAESLPAPVVSVVVPARDAGATIGETITSVLRQTVADWELIVVDDGSRDETVARVQGFDDPRVRVISSERRGLGAARNLGLDSAVGEFVAFLDADDLWASDKLESHVEALRAQPRAAFVYAWTLFIDEKSRYLFAKRPKSTQGDVSMALQCEYFLASGSNLFARRSVALAVGGFDEALWAAQDWDFALKLARQGELALVPRFQVFYRIAEGALSSDADRSASACRTVVRQNAEPGSSASWHRAASRSIREYQVFLLLSRSPAMDFQRRARRVLRRGIADDPGWITSMAMWKLSATAFACSVVPSPLRRRLIFALLRLTGAWQWFRRRPVRTALADVPTRARSHLQPADRGSAPLSSMGGAASDRVG